MSESAGLFEDAVGIFAEFAIGRFLAEDLGVAGNGGEGIFEFVRYAGGHFAKRGEIFFQAELALEVGELGEVGHEAERAGDDGVFVRGGGRVGRSVAGRNRRRRARSWEGRVRWAKW